MKRYIVSISILIVILFSTVIFASDDRISLGYIYNSSESHIDLVNNTNGNINVVSPTCFDLTLDGHLKINDIFDQGFIAEMKNQGIKVTPFLSNHWGRKRAEAALSKPNILVDEIVEVINKYDLDGINIDFENLLPSDRDGLTNFIRILRENMPKDKILSVAVAANPEKLKKTWLAAYDYKSLGEYADYLFLMAYDEHSIGGSEGPVASIGFVRKSLEVILESVSRDKVVLGMPLYGRFWKKDVESGGEAVVIAQIEKIIKRYNCVPKYDEKTGTTIATINVKSSDKKAYVNGRYLEEGTYTIWYENENSILKKLALMNEYMLKGAGLWALGNEGKDFWNYYSEGFFNESYESEQSVKERTLYEYVEYLKKEVETLKLSGSINVENKFLKKSDENKLAAIKILHVPFSNNEEMNTTINVEKISDVSEKIKRIDRYEISHMIRRGKII